MKFALIEMPDPNSAEAKYISQVPSPNNLLQIATALRMCGHEVTVINLFREHVRVIPELDADAYVFDIFPCTCMDYYADYALSCLYSSMMWAIGKPYREPELAVRAIKLLQAHKLNPACFQLIGMPTQTRESILEDIRIFTELGVRVRAQILWQYPGVSYHPTLSPEELKELCRKALEQTGSLAWKHKTG